MRSVIMSNSKKLMINWTIAALALALIVGCSGPNKPGNGQDQTNTATTGQQNTNANTPNSPSSSSTASDSIVYKNTQYGFNFTLPESWKNYSIVSSQWEALAQESQQTGKTANETGPIISIRDPQWTSKIPRQDIPIMVFTLDQWVSLQQGIFHIGAAPIGPSELGRNNSYVFALPARYNFAFPAGYEEVETILKSNPLQAAQTAQLQPVSMESLLSNMMALGEQGKVINSDYAVKTTTIEDVEKAWGNADKTDYIATAKGSYATYTNHNVVFGINKGDQIFEVRCYDNRLAGLTLAKTKEVLGTPAYDAKDSNQEIIGYATDSEFKVEMVFPQPTADQPDPVMDHYNVLYPNGTVNEMTGDPGRQW
ncbi:Antirepressor regulating drug resistance protein (fragment) [Candidatus Desulfosporosinus infrequens]|uniref:Antirepressor regulating drug resistance protein n=1 Tax=Candidatus Desulfosporosinus infrequens TaxID=2043169 RepID=A0A2U3KNJ8_9FIRM